MGLVPSNCRALLKSPLPDPLPTSPSWGEGIDRGLGGGIKMRPSRRYGRILTFLAAWIFERFLPLLQEFIRLAGAVQIRKTRHLPSNLPDALVQFLILQLPAFIKFLPGLWNRGLLRNHPGVERAADIAQTLQR